MNELDNVDMLPYFFQTVMSQSSVLFCFRIYTNWNLNCLNMRDADDMN